MQNNYDGRMAETRIIDNAAAYRLWQSCHRFAAERAGVYSFGGINHPQVGLLGSAGLRIEGHVMKDEVLRAAVGQFLKNINFSAQREIEKVVRKAVASGKLEGDEVITVGVTLSSGTIDLNLTIYNKIELSQRAR